MSNVKKNLLYLFDRPTEPVIVSKGENNAIFQLTEEFLPEDYKKDGLVINNRYGEDAGEIIPLEKLKKKPNINNAKQLPNDTEFSILLPKHEDMANEVISALMSVPENDLQQFLSTCVYCRANLNPQLFNYAFCVALMHRNDTKDVPIQNFAETFPSKFVDSQAFSQAREVSTVLSNTTRIPIIIPRDFTATDLDEEHRLAYFREDIGVNLHHWHWHLVFPFSGLRNIVAKDRRGELFYYMHQQIIARYNCERLDNGLKRVLKHANWREPIPEAYYPKLDSLTSSRGYPPRQANMRWQDINRPADGAKATISQMETWNKRIDECITTGLVQMPDGTTKQLDIDTLGNIVEPSILSPNKELYGNLHNFGHNISAFIHDPNHRYLEALAIMGDTATNMRDPYFYRWHAYIDGLFHKFKESTHVRPYSSSQLRYDGIQITSASVQSSTGQKNVFNTFWMQSDVDLSRGLDFSDRGAIYVRFTHLNCRSFYYEIAVNNTTGMARKATARIFLAPKYDERKLPWSLVDQRKMFIEMDRFVVTLNAGMNTIRRQSTESSITIPFEQTFRDLSVQGSNAKRPELAGFNYCGCGWPQHMLVPRGTESGSAYQLFIMFSNYDLDKVDQPNVEELTCVEASSFCGLKDRLYPDKRDMGFPFDRPSTTANNIEDFILPNMTLIECTIKLQSGTETNPNNVVE